MQCIKIGYGKSLNLGDYHNKEISDENLDIEIRAEDGDVIQVNTRKHGYAVRLVTENGRKTRTLLDKNS